MAPRRHPFPKIIERVRGLSIFCLKSDRIAGTVRQKRIEVRVPKHADPRALQDVSLTDRPTSMGAPFKPEVAFMEDLYRKIDFIVSGGALEYLSEFLRSKGLTALILEPREAGYQVLDAVGLSPDSLTFQEADLKLGPLFPQRPPKGSFEVEAARGSDPWPCVLRIRGAQWAIFVLLGKRPEDALLSEIQPYAGMIRLWQTFQKIDATEQRLSRLSYMILTTKNTLASIFEPMPLQYFTAFLADVLRESLFPKTVTILNDDGTALTPIAGRADSVPDRTGVYQEEHLPPTPVLTRSDRAPFEAVLPIAEEPLRLFCVLTWDNLPDAHVLNFMELLGNLAVRAIAINALREQSRRASEENLAGEFTAMTLSNVLKVLKGAPDRAHFCSLLADVLMEQGRLPNCILAIWDQARGGYVCAAKRTNRLADDPDEGVLLTSLPVAAPLVHEAQIDLRDVSADTALKAWGLDKCPWASMASMTCLFPICDDRSLIGLAALGSDDRATPTKDQLAALRLIAQFSAYEFHRF